MVDTQESGFKVANPNSKVDLSLIKREWSLVVPVNRFN